MFITNDPHLIFWLIGLLVKLAVITVVVVLVVKGIKYLKRKEEREMRRDYRAAQDTIDEIERELNERKDYPLSPRRRRGIYIFQGSCPHYA